jgi:hypothetical protein
MLHFCCFNSDHNSPTHIEKSCCSKEQNVNSSQQNIDTEKRIIDLTEQLNHTTKQFEIVKQKLEFLQDQLEFEKKLEYEEKYKIHLDQHRPSFIKQTTIYEKQIELDNEQGKIDMEYKKLSVEYKKIYELQKILNDRRNQFNKTYELSGLDMFYLCYYNKNLNKLNTYSAGNTTQVNFKGLVQYVSQKSVTSVPLPLIEEKEVQSAPPSPDYVHRSLPIFTNEIQPNSAPSSPEYVQRTISSLSNSPVNRNRMVYTSDSPDIIYRTITNTSNSPDLSHRITNVLEDSTVSSIQPHTIRPYDEKSITNEIIIENVELYLD